MSKIYISGKISGLEISEAKLNFERAEIRLIEAGQQPVNVMKIFDNVEGWGWEEYMLADIKLLFSCGGIYMLSNWENSRGARIEHAIARELGLHIEYENE